MSHPIKKQNEKTKWKNEKKAVLLLWPKVEEIIENVAQFFSFSFVKFHSFLLKILFLVEISYFKHFLYQFNSELFRHCLRIYFEH